MAAVGCGAHISRGANPSDVSKLGKLACDPVLSNPGRARTVWPAAAAWRAAPWLGPPVCAAASATNDHLCVLGGNPAAWGPGSLRVLTGCVRGRTLPCRERRRQSIATYRSATGAFAPVQVREAAQYTQVRTRSLAQPLVRPPSPAAAHARHVARLEALATRQRRPATRKSRAVLPRSLHVGLVVAGASGECPVLGSAGLHGAADARRRSNAWYTQPAVLPAPGHGRPAGGSGGRAGGRGAAGCCAVAGRPRPRGGRRRFRRRGRRACRQAASPGGHRGGATTQRAAAADCLPCAGAAATSGRLVVEARGGHVPRGQLPRAVHRVHHAAPGGPRVEG